MPKAAMDEDRRSMLRQNDVRRSWKRSSVDSEAQSLTV